MKSKRLTWVLPVLSLFFLSVGVVSVSWSQGLAQRDSLALSPVPCVSWNSSDDYESYKLVPVEFVAILLESEGRGDTCEITWLVYDKTGGERRLLSSGKGQEALILDPSDPRKCGIVESAIPKEVRENDSAFQAATIMVLASLERLGTSIATGLRKRAGQVVARDSVEFKMDWSPPRVELPWSGDSDRVEWTNVFRGRLILGVVDVCGVDSVEVQSSFYEVCGDGSQPRRTLSSSDTLRLHEGITVFRTVAYDGAARGFYSGDCRIDWIPAPNAGDTLYAVAVDTSSPRITGISFESSCGGMPNRLPPDTVLPGLQPPEDTGSNFAFAIRFILSDSLSGVHRCSLTVARAGHLEDGVHTGTVLPWHKACVSVDMYMEDASLCADSTNFFKVRRGKSRAEVCVPVSVPREWTGDTLVVDISCQDLAGNASRTTAFLVPIPKPRLAPQRYAAPDTMTVEWCLPQRVQFDSPTRLELQLSTDRNFRQVCVDTSWGVVGCGCEEGWCQSLVPLPCDLVRGQKLFRRARLISGNFPSGWTLPDSVFLDDLAPHVDIEVDYTPGDTTVKIMVHASDGEGAGLKTVEVLTCTDTSLACWAERSGRCFPCVSRSFPISPGGEVTHPVEWDTVVSWDRPFDPGDGRYLFYAKTADLVGNRLSLLDTLLWFDAVKPVVAVTPLHPITSEQGRIRLFEVEAYDPVNPSCASGVASLNVTVTTEKGDSLPSDCTRIPYSDTWRCSVDCSVPAQYWGWLHCEVIAIDSAGNLGFAVDSTFWPEVSIVPFDSGLVHLGARRKERNPDWNMLLYGSPEDLKDWIVPDTALISFSQEVWIREIRLLDTNTGSELIPLWVRPSLPSATDTLMVSYVFPFSDRYRLTLGIGEKNASKKGTIEREFKAYVWKDYAQAISRRGESAGDTILVELPPQHWSVDYRLWLNDLDFSNCANVGSRPDFGSPGWRLSAGADQGKLGTPDSVLVQKIVWLTGRRAPSAQDLILNVEGAAQFSLVEKDGALIAEQSDNRPFGAAIPVDFFLCAREVHLSDRDRFYVYPNPWQLGKTPRVTFVFFAEETGEYIVRVYDFFGEKVWEARKNVQVPKTYVEVNWNGSGVSSGGYLCELKSRNGTIYKKLGIVGW